MCLEDDRVVGGCCIVELRGGGDSRWFGGHSCWSKVGAAGQGAQRVAQSAAVAEYIHCVAFRGSTVGFDAAIHLRMRGPRWSRVAWQPWMCSDVCIHAYIRGAKGLRCPLSPLTGWPPAKTPLCGYDSSWLEAETDTSQFEDSHMCMCVLHRVRI